MWLSLGEIITLPCPTQPLLTPRPLSPDDILGKGAQHTAPVSCCLKEVVARENDVEKAQEELNTERNNNTSVFQTLLYTSCSSKHVTYSNSINPHVCPLRHALVLSPFYG